MEIAFTEDALRPDFADVVRHDVRACCGNEDGWAAQIVEFNKEATERDRSEWLSGHCCE